MFPIDATSCSAEEIDWNGLKGSWNLSLQTLGWGRYLAQEQGQTPILWDAMTSNQFLNDGYGLLTGDCLRYLPLILKD